MVMRVVAWERLAGSRNADRLLERRVWEAVKRTLPLHSNTKANEKVGELLAPSWCLYLGLSLLVVD